MEILLTLLISRGKSVEIYLEQITCDASEGVSLAVRALMDEVDTATMADRRL